MEPDAPENSTERQAPHQSRDPIPLDGVEIPDGSLQWQDVKIDGLQGLQRRLLLVCKDGKGYDLGFGEYQNCSVIDATGDDIQPKITFPIFILDHWSPWFFFSVNLEHPHDEYQRVDIKATAEDLGYNDKSFYIYAPSGAAKSKAGGEAFEAGSKIDSNYRSTGLWYPGTIAKINEDGTFLVQYDNDKTEDKVPAINIRLKVEGVLNRHENGRVYLKIKSANIAFEERAIKEKKPITGFKLGSGDTITGEVRKAFSLGTPDEDGIFTLYPSSTAVVKCVMLPIHLTVRGKIINSYRNDTFDIRFQELDERGGLLRTVQREELGIPAARVNG